MTKTTPDMITVSEMIVLLQALPPDAEVFCAQEYSERAYRAGEPYLTPGKDVVISIGAIFIDAGDNEDDEDE